MFESRKNSILSDRIKMIEYIKTEKINFGISDNEENLSIFYAVIIYSAFEKKIEFYYDKQLKLKIFTISPSGFIMAYHKDRTNGMKRLKEEKARIEKEGYQTKDKDNQDKKGDSNDGNSRNMGREESNTFTNRTDQQRRPSINPLKSKEMDKMECNELKEPRHGQEEERGRLLNKFSTINSGDSYEPPHRALRPQSRVSNFGSRSQETEKEKEKSKQNQPSFPRSEEVLQEKQIKISLTPHHLFNITLFNKNIDVLCHPDSLEKFTQELWSFYKKDESETAELLSSNQLLVLFQSDLKYGQKFAYITTLLIMFMAFSSINDINDMSTFQELAFFTLCLIQLFFLSLNLSYFLYYNLVSKSQERSFRDKHPRESLFFGYLTVKKGTLKVLSECLSTILYLVLVISAIMFEIKWIFLTLQMFFIYQYSDTIRSIYNAFLSRLEQLASLLFIVIVIIIVFATLGFFLYNPEFNLSTPAVHLSSTDLDSESALISLEDKQQSTINVCSTLLSCVYFYFNFGMRAGGGIGDHLKVKGQDEDFYWIRFLFDILFFTIIILLFLNMLNGIIINGFSKYREKMEEIEDAINNRCFICNLHKSSFDKKKLSFKRHCDYEHNPYNYFLFIETLKSKGLHNLSLEEKELVSIIKKKQITNFPIETGFKYSMKNVDTTI